jgi:hypothetical protein
MSGIGLAAIITALVALVAVFVSGKSSQRKELQEKKETLIPAGVPPPANP